MSSPRLGLVDLSEAAAARLRMLAVVEGLVVVVALGLLALVGWMPRNPEGDWFRHVEGPAQFALLGVILLGLALSRRYTAVAAVLIALGGVGLSVIAAIGYPPSVALIVALAFLTPAVLLWVTWQRRETPLRIAALAVSTGLLLAGSWLGADAVYQHFFGPAHPESSTPAIDDPLVEWAWSGAAGSDGFTVVAKPRASASVVELLVWEQTDDPHADPRERTTASVVDGVASLSVDGLRPATGYRYGIAVDGDLTSRWDGAVETAPDELRIGERITIALSSCARTGSNGSVFDAIRAVSPDLYIATGDLHYANIARDDVTAFSRAYDRVLTSPAQSALYRSVPIAYVWDDHDFSANDGDSSSPSRPAARASYERTVPHHPLVDDVTINQAFSIGPVRVVVLDTRSARVPGSTILGADQLAWLQRELLTSSPTHDVVVIVSPTPWIGAASDTSDSWAGFADERRQLANFIADHELENLLIASGDAHMVAIDDGTNSDYADGGGAAMPVLQAAALDRPGNVKGGPYSEGTFPGAGQFGVIEVHRTGDGIEVVLEGRRYDGSVIVTHRPTMGSGDD